MPPGGEGEGEGEGEHGITVQSHPLATVRRDEDAPPHSTPPLPDVPPVASKDKKQNLEQEQQPVPNLPEGAQVEILSRVPYRSLCRLSACPSRGSPSAPPPTSARGRRRPSPASSTTKANAFVSAICVGEVRLWSTLPCLSCAAATKTFMSNNSAKVFSSAAAGIRVYQANVIMLCAILPLESGLCCLL